MPAPGSARASSAFSPLQEQTSSRGTEDRTARRDRGARREARPPGDRGNCRRVRSRRLRAGHTEAIRQLGRIDILVNNAGIGTARPALRESPAEFRAVIDVNLEGAYWKAQEFARAKDRGSSIVNIASTLGSIASYAPQAAYAAS
ncbi:MULTISPECIES: SDR family NAD(P)-dependent oxidoreductase [unclassified Pseudonocardia]|uniref:SDR family NAD(P)-dependent oxidoreductase n=1 Tax=unclassified Pseudonocardia TaxID=2619320 RepID=UPI00094B4095|nr:SDR family NAD(P)-dependent oxidoreductase [Pseudonocardia sp. Ae707_Ps1]